MTSLPEIFDLFTKLASHLHRNSSHEQGPESEPLTLAISSLNKSLNRDSTPVSASRVLDTALSLMCFKASEVFDSSIQCLSETIIAVLYSSVSCRVLRFPKDDDLLQVGSLISCGDCTDLIQACADVIQSLEGYGSFSHKLLHAVLKVATSASCNQGMFPLPCMGYENSSCKRKAAVLKLHSFLPEETSAVASEAPLRSLSWYLDPFTLKNDISRIVQELIERPFLCLKRELHERMAWRSVVICLVTSPAIFIEAKDLLHHWLLMTGLASVLEFRIELVVSLLDALTRPMSWDISMELGMKLPFSHAYFPSEHHHLLGKLVGPISCESFLDLVCVLLGPVDYSKEHVDFTAWNPSCGIFKQAVSATAMIDHKSSWAMLMDFPAWFYFAATALFLEKQCQEIFPSAFIPRTAEIERPCDLELRCAAARYLAWILNPVNEVQCHHLFGYLTEISGLWITMQEEADTVNCRKKLKKPRNKTIEAKRCNIVGMELFLKDFHDRCIKYHNKVNDDYEGNTAPISIMRPNLLLRRILFGILIGHSKCFDEKVCELLLHYVATGEIQKSEGCDGAGDRIWWSKETNVWEGPVSGASVVFYLFDLIEDMLTSMFESEDCQCDFIYSMKGKAARYLFRCIEKLLELKTGKEEGRPVILRDLSNRLSRWWKQGREGFEGSDSFKIVACDLNHEINSLYEWFSSINL